MNAELNYRFFIKEIFAKKSADNKGYSLRAFAKRLQMSPSHLSRVLNGQNRMSLETATQVCSCLNLSQDQTKYFMDLVMLESASSDPQKQVIMERLMKQDSQKTSSSVDLESFRVISTWYHFAILGLTRLKNFKADHRWIAKKLRISLAEVKVAVDRLLALNLLEEQKDTYVAKNESNVEAGDEIASMAVKKYHSQMLEKAASSQNTQGVDEREFQALTLGFSMKHMPKAKKMILEFVEKMNHEFDTGEGSDLYQLNVQFFRLTRKDNDYDN